MKKTNLSNYDPTTVPDGSKYRIGVIAAEWNPEVTNALLDGAVGTLLEHGVKEENLIVRRVPGTFDATSSSSVKPCRKALPMWPSNTNALSSSVFLLPTPCSRLSTVLAGNTVTKVSKELLPPSK